MWNFGNNFARNVIIFGVDNSSSSHSSNQKNNVLVFVIGRTESINDSIVAAEKSFIINFKAKFGLIFHYNDVNSYLLVDGKEVNKFRANNENV